MTKADQIIVATERAADEYRKRTGCDIASQTFYQVGWLMHEIRKAYDLLAEATNPSGCHDVTIDGITYGMQWDKGDECWLAYIGGQVVNVALSSWLLDKLCDEAERIALDGEAA